MYISFCLNDAREDDENGTPITKLLRWKMTNDTNHLLLEFLLESQVNELGFIWKQMFYDTNEKKKKKKIKMVEQKEKDQSPFSCV